MPLGSLPVVCPQHVWTKGGQQHGVQVVKVYGEKESFILRAVTIISNDQDKKKSGRTLHARNRSVFGVSWTKFQPTIDR